MKQNKTKGVGLDLLWLALGAACYALVGWRWSAPAAAWAAPVFLLRFFRNQDRWYASLLCLPFLYVAFAANMIGAWDLPVAAQVLLPAIVPLPLVAGLYVDRTVSRRLPGLAATLVFPAVTVSVDYLMGFTPLGTLFSAASTQFSFTTVAQLASLTGIWGIAFVIAWFAAVCNAAWERGFDLAALRRPAAAFAVTAAAVLLYGSVRIAVPPAEEATVRVAGITVEHPRDYWALLDNGTSRQEVDALRPELRRLEDALFADSRRAVQAGARIVFWSEGNAVLAEDDLERFLGRAGSFARDHQIYLAPAILELRYGSMLNYNQVLMFTPEGKLAFGYQKTKSWLPVEADGLIRSVRTPYGTLAAAICFDLDFPGFMRQAARAGTDIMLVPGYDSQRIRPFHSEPALLRGVEGGYAVVRQANEGTSMAADRRGTLLARQDFFGTEDRLMLADVPTRGARTLYGRLGDWFAWASMGLLVFLCLFAARGGRMSAGRRR